MQKAKEKCYNHGEKEKAAEYYLANKYVIKEKEQMISIKIYYWFNRSKILKDAWDKYHNKRGREKAAKNYAANKELLRQRDMTETEK